jgi:hypothetical protein
MTKSPAFQEIERQYFFLETRFNALFRACTTDLQRDEFRRLYVASRDNYYLARGKILSDGDPIVAGMTQDLKRRQRDIETDTRTVADIASVLKAITAAVETALKLVTLVAV